MLLRFSAFSIGTADPPGDGVRLELDRSPPGTRTHDRAFHPKHKGGRPRRVPCGRTRLRCTGGGESDATHGALAKIEGALFSGVVPVSRLRASPVLLRNVSVLGGSLAARTSHEQRGA
jgi:hypothetical protein